MPLTVLSVAYPLAKVTPGTAGGAEQVLLTLDKALVHLGHRSIVVAAAGSRCEGLLVAARIPEGELSRAAREQAQQTFRQTVHRALRDFEIDVVHMHGLDFHEYLPDGIVPEVVTLHLPLAWYEARHLRTRGQNTILVAVSRDQAKRASDEMKIDAVIPNGIDLDAYALTRHKGNYALVMGRICAEKGVHLAIDAATQSGTPILIAGKAFEYPEHRNYFENVIRPRLGRSVRFVGSVGGKRKANLLAGAKCLLVPSQAPETSSLVAMEALASGTPVIAWRSGALGDIVEHGRTGWLVSSVQEMAAAMTHVDEIDPARCRTEAERRFSAEHMIASYMNLYEQVTTAAVVKEMHAA